MMNAQDRAILNSFFTSVKPSGNFEEDLAKLKTFFVANARQILGYTQRGPLEAFIMLVHTGKTLHGQGFGWNGEHGMTCPPSDYNKGKDGLALGIGNYFGAYLTKNPYAALSSFKGNDNRGRALKLLGNYSRQIMKHVYKYHNVPIVEASFNNANDGGHVHPMFRNGTFRLT